MIMPAGNYPAVVVPVTNKEGTFWCQFGESGKKKTPLAAVQFQVIRGPQAGRRITWLGYLPEDNHEVGDRTIRGLRACGFTGDDLAAFLFQEVKQECEIVVEHETYTPEDGPTRTRARVQWVNAVGGGGLKTENTMKDQQLRLFAAKLKSRVKAQAEVKGPVAVLEEATPGTTTDRGGSYDQGAGGGSSDDAPEDFGARDTKGPIDDDQIPF